MVAIGRTAGGVDEALDLGVARGDQHVDKAGDIGGVGRNGIGDAARHRAERRLMQHVIDALTGAATGVEVADVALDEFEPCPLRWLDERLHLIEVALIAGRKIIQPDDPLIELEQRLQQIGADEAGDAGDQPGPRRLRAGRRRLLRNGSFSGSYRRRSD